MIEKIRFKDPSFKPGINVAIQRGRLAHGVIVLPRGSTLELCDKDGKYVCEATLVSTRYQPVGEIPIEVLAYVAGLKCKTHADLVEQLNSMSNSAVGIHTPVTLIVFIPEYRE